MSRITAFLLFTAAVLGWSLVALLGTTRLSQSGVVSVVGLGNLLLLGAFSLGLRVHGRATWLAASMPLGGSLVTLAVGLARRGALGIPLLAVGVVALFLARREREARAPRLA